MSAGPRAIFFVMRSHSGLGLRSYPSQTSTGNRGYFANRGSWNDSSHMKKTEPRSDSIRRACWQSAHKPAFVLSKLSLPVTDFALVLLRPKADRSPLHLRPLARPRRIECPANARSDHEHQEQNKKYERHKEVQTLRRFQ